MANDYEKINNSLKRIKTFRGKDMGFIASNLNYDNSCIITGGKDLKFSSGANVPNRKLILEAIIKELIIKTKRSIVVFYKSPFIKYRMIEWLRKNNIRRECNFIGNLENGMGKCLAPFKNMSDEEIIYAVRSMAISMNITFDQFAETFLENLLRLIKRTGYPIDFGNIMILIRLSNEELTRLASKFDLETESKYFSKFNNGSETVKRVLKELQNYLGDYYQEDSTIKLNICSEVLNDNVVFIEVGDQYHTEILEYFCNELKCCSSKSPYIIFDDIMLKNNPNFEDYLLKSTGVRFFMGAVDISAMLSQENFEDFVSQAATKFLLHYDNANAAEKVTSSIGHYYHMKVSEEETKNREAFHIMNDNISIGRSVTEEKRLIIEGTDLTELDEFQLYLIDTTFDRFYFDTIKY
ncbi:MAG: hypothetical protein ACI4E3_03270 [Candidatus Fimousia sp.]